MNLNSDYIKGWLNGYVEGKRIQLLDNAYYIKHSKDKLYKMCELFLEQLSIPICYVDKNTSSFSKGYITVDEINQEYLKGYLTSLFDIKLKAYISFYRFNRLNKEYYLQLITTHPSLITNLTKALKVFGIHYKLLFIPQTYPYSHKYRIRITRLKDIKFIKRLSLTNSILKSKINRITED